MMLISSLSFPSRYFLRKLKKVKRSHGQVLAINEVEDPAFYLLV